MDKTLEKSYGVLLLYMATAAQLLYAQYQKDPTLLTIEEQVIKMTELAMMITLMALVREKTLKKSIYNWKSFVDFLEMRKIKF